MAGLLPDGEGVIARKAPPGMVIALYASIFAAGVMAVLGLQSLIANDVGVIRAASAAPAATVDQKLDRVLFEVGELKTTTRRLEATTSNTERDVAVIKRQLGLDGLGPAVGRRSP